MGGGRERGDMCEDGSRCFVFCSNPSEMHHEPHTGLTLNAPPRQDTVEPWTESIKNQSDATRVQMIGLTVTVQSSFQFYILATKDKTVLYK